MFITHGFVSKLAILIRHYYGEDYYKLNIDVLVFMSENTV